MIADTIDTEPGHYYVTMKDYDRTAWLLGPYVSHAKALALVPEAKRLAKKVDPFAHFYAFGTARIPLELKPKLGVLNDMLT